LECVEFDANGKIKPDSIIPMIDGGTTGWQGQARVVVPFDTACFECTLQSLPPAVGFHLCTIASKPRKPEHCIAYAMQMQWPLLEKFNGVEDYTMRESKDELDAEGNPVAEEGKITFDSDNAEHMSWIWHRSVERAKKFQIAEPSYSMTMQVAKNIIPAIASTNAVVAAACVNEAFKILARSHPRMNSYFQYNGHTGLHCETFPYNRNPDCDVCADPVHWKFNKDATLADFVKKQKELFPDIEVKEDKKKEKKEKVKAKAAPSDGEKALVEQIPALSFKGKLIYMKATKAMNFEDDLPKKLSSFGMKNNSEVHAVADQRIRRIIVNFE